MINDLIAISWLSACFLGLFGVSELIHRTTSVKVEHTRKFVHFGTGVLTLLFPVFLSSSWSVLFLCASFAVILLLSLKYQFLPSINAIDRKSHGSILYPVAVYSCFLLYEYHHSDLMFFYAPVLVLAISDPMAALFGKRWPKGEFTIGNDSKTVMGCSAFFGSALVILAVLGFLFYGSGFFTFEQLYLLILVSLGATLVEAVSGKGSDNLTIPLSVVLLLSLFASL
ncbi:Cytidylyltransferase family protein [compost metagenome]